MRLFSFVFILLVGHSLSETMSYSSISYFKPLVCRSITNIKDSSSAEKKLNAFLKNPFDLYAFRKKSGANSGGYGTKKYYYKPNREGGYWYFFLFEPIVSEDWMVMITYKTKGPHYNDYEDPTEELIDLTMKENAKNLPELSFINKSKDEIVKEFGSGYFMIGDTMVYSRNERSLILYLKGNGVIKLRYAHFNKTLTATSIIPEDPLSHK